MRRHHALRGLLARQSLSTRRLGVRIRVCRNRPWSQSQLERLLCRQCACAVVLLHRNTQIRLRDASYLNCSAKRGEWPKQIRSKRGEGPQFCPPSILPLRCLSTAGLRASLFRYSETRIWIGHHSISNKFASRRRLRQQGRLLALAKLLTCCGGWSIGGIGWPSVLHGIDGSQRTLPCSGSALLGSVASVARRGQPGPGT